jgi:hypothetical protein
MQVTYEIKSRIYMAEKSSREIFHKNLEVSWRKRLVQFCNFEDEIWTIKKIGKKYIENSEVWC